jgi:peptidoglycan/xylan/chitin deacetylase (PgdA/CDA1 family)
MRNASRLAPGRRLAVLLAGMTLLVAACGPASPTPSGSSAPDGQTPSVSPGASEAPSASPGSSAAAASAPASSGASPSATPRPSPTPVAHMVASGETLTSIARIYGTTPRSIAYWNRVTYPSLDPDSDAYDPNTIEVGWVLVVWPGRVVDEASPPPGPSPTPTPLVTLPPGPTPPADGTSLLVSHGPRSGNGVALTFDMGGRLDPALQIVDWLIAHDVAATVFPTGKTGSETAVGKEVLARVAAHPELFDVGNHSWDHPYLTGLDRAAIGSQLTRTEEAVAPLAGQTTKPLFRPPYGAQDLAVRRAAGALGWTYTVTWDVDTVDWKAESDGGPTADDIVARVLTRVQPGSIVLMHLGGYETLDALPRIVAGLQDRGLQPVTLGAMLGPG